MDARLFEAARGGDVAALAAMLDDDPERLHARDEPYAFTLLHAAARAGRLEVVDVLLRRGLHPDVRERGDNTTPMHWAAAGGHLAVVRRLTDAGADIVGEGDDHGLGVIGWTTCFGGDEDVRRAVADFLVSRGARHHIFSAVAMNLADEVRRIVAARPAALNQRLTRNDNERTPLHHAVLAGRPDMVALLVELGADPLAIDGFGCSVAVYATAPDVDLPVMRAVRGAMMRELASADAGDRPPQVGVMDLVAMLALGEWSAAERVVRARPQAIASTGALHLMAKRGALEAVGWLIGRGADPNARWAHWDAEVTPLHLAAPQGHMEVVRALVAAGADPTIRDSKHGGDAAGWAEYGRMPPSPHWREIVALCQRRHSGA